MITGLSRRRHLATRAAWAAVLVTAIFVSPSMLGLSWRLAQASGGGSLQAAPLRLAMVVAGICLAWPPLSRRRDDSLLGPEEPLWAVSATGALFAICALAPAVVLAPTLVSGGSGGAFWDLALAGAVVGLSAASAATRAAWRPGYALLALGVAAALVLAVASEWGAGSQASGAKPPGVSGASGQDEGRVWPVLVPVEGSGPGQLALEGYPPLLLQSDWLAGERRDVRAWMVGPGSASDWEVFAGEGSGAAGVVPLTTSGEFRAPAWSIRGGASLVEDGQGWPVVGLLVALLGLVACVAIQRSPQLGPAGRAGAHVVVAAAGVLGVGMGAIRTTAGAPGPDSSGLDEVGARAGVTVTEGRRLLDGSSEWIQIRRAFGVLECSLDGASGTLSGEVVVGGRLGVERTERDVRRGRGAARIVARDPLAPIDWRRSFESGLRLLL
ncbi:MAG: hypothetical protein ACJA2W_000762, partial [Planctomycetota bacterium]